MPTLDDEIARVAALRGCGVADVHAAASERRRYPTRPEVEVILRSNPDPADDLAHFDILPSRSRAFIRDQQRPLNAHVWAELLQRVGDEDEIIKAVAYCLGAT